MSEVNSLFISRVLRGNDQSTPKAGPVSWALHKLYVSIVMQFAKHLATHEPGFNRARFLEDCGVVDR